MWMDSMSPIWAPCGLLCAAAGKPSTKGVKQAVPYRTGCRGLVNQMKISRPCSWDVCARALRRSRQASPVETNVCLHHIMCHSWRYYYVRVREMNAQEHYGELGRLHPWKTVCAIIISCVILEGIIMCMRTFRSSFWERVLSMLHRAQQIIWSLRRTTYVHCTCFLKLSTRTRVAS